MLQCRSLCSSLCSSLLLQLRATDPGPLTAHRGRILDNLLGQWPHPSKALQAPS